MDIYEVFDQILSAARSVDVAESEFKRLMYEDPLVRTAYREWCNEQGTTEKHGFVDYCQETFDQEESRWETLNEDAEYNYE